MLPSDGLRGLYADETATGASVAKTLKVKVPLRHVLQLRTHQLYRGRTFSSTVQEALEAYFVRLQAEMGAEKAS